MPASARYTTKQFLCKIIGCIFLLLIILFNGCDRVTDAKRAKLNDTLAKLREHLAYIPLDSAEVYDFINKYYLPRLDSTPIGRKIFFMPLKGRDFYGTYVRVKKELEANYREHTLSLRSPAGVKLLPPPPIMFDTTFKWNSKKLLNAKVIADTSFFNISKNPRVLRIKEIEAWRKKYGYGYMCISYPQYNPYTKRLLIKEWIENYSWCGTGRDQEFGFTKIPGGWRADE